MIISKVECFITKSILKLEPGCCPPHHPDNYCVGPNSDKMQQMFTATMRYGTGVLRHDLIVHQGLCRAVSKGNSQETIAGHLTGGTHLTVTE